jgi:hypothetical protein
VKRIRSEKGIKAININSIRIKTIVKINTSWIRYVTLIQTYGLPPGIPPNVGPSGARICE